MKSGPVCNMPAWGAGNPLDNHCPGFVWSLQNNRRG